MNVIFLLLGGVFTSGLFVIARNLRFAPVGYEDQTGFHFGDQPIAEGTQQTVNSNEIERNAPKFAIHPRVATKAHDTKTLKFADSVDRSEPAKTNRNHAA